MAGDCRTEICLRQQQKATSLKITVVTIKTADLVKLFEICNCIYNNINTTNWLRITL